MSSVHFKALEGVSGDAGEQALPLLPEPSEVQEWLSQLITVPGSWGQGPLQGLESRVRGWEVSKRPEGSAHALSPSLRPGPFLGLQGTELALEDDAPILLKFCDPSTIPTYKNLPPSHGQAQGHGMRVSHRL